jgi:hypothetical protein
MQVSGTIKINSRSQVNKSNQNHYPIDDDTSVSELAHLVFTMAGSGLKSAQIR